MVDNNLLGHVELLGRLHGGNEIIFLVNISPFLPSIRQTLWCMLNGCFAHFIVNVLNFFITLMGTTRLEY